MEKRRSRYGHYFQPSNVHVLLIAQIALLRNAIRNDLELSGRLFVVNGFEDKLVISYCGSDFACNRYR